MSFSQAMQAFLESGCGLLVASVDAHGAPHASRGWALDVVGPDRVRLLVGSEDTRLIENVGEAGVVAITATNVPTLRSVQLKGHATNPVSGTDADVTRMRRYCDAFFADIGATDGTPPELLERLVPASLIAYVIDVEAVFDQTPGPKAGAVLTDE